MLEYALAVGGQQRRIDAVERRAAHQADREARSWSASACSLHRILAQAALLISRACVNYAAACSYHGQP